MIFADCQLIFTDYLVAFAYVVILPLIIHGIRHKKQWVRFERALVIGVKQTINDYKTGRK